MRGYDFIQILLLRIAGEWIKHCDNPVKSSQSERFFNGLIIFLL